MKEYTSGQVYDAARTGLNAIYVIARNDIRKRWKHMTREQRYNAMRGLVVIGRVARDPQKYLSRANTEAEWCARAKAFAAAHNLHVSEAYYFVQTPEGNVVNAAGKALFGNAYGGGGMHAELYNLTENIRRYDYQSTSQVPWSRGFAPKRATDIVATAKRLNDQATRIQSKLMRCKTLKSMMRGK